MVKRLLRANRKLLSDSRIRDPCERLPPGFRRGRLCVSGEQESSILRPSPGNSVMEESTAPIVYHSDKADMHEQGG